VAALAFSGALLAGAFCSFGTLLVVLGLLLTGPGLCCSLTTSGLRRLLTANRFGGFLLPDLLGLPLASARLALPLTLEVVLLGMAPADATALGMFSVPAEHLVTEAWKCSTALLVAGLDAFEHTLHHLALLEGLELAGSRLTAVELEPDGVTPLDNGAAALLLHFLLLNPHTVKSFLGFNDPTTHSTLVLHSTSVLSVC